MMIAIAKYTLSAATFQIEIFLMIKTAEWGGDFLPLSLLIKFKYMRKKKMTRRDLMEVLNNYPMLNLINVCKSARFFLNTFKKN